MDSLMNHFCAGVVGIVVDSDEVIEGFDEFGFGLRGIEVGKRRHLPGLLLLVLKGSVATLQSPHGRLARCSSWHLRFVVYSSGANLNRR
jgi:hypothetical protein